MRLDIQEIIKLLDCYVLPSFWEGLPMVLLEAMAVGCPIVATDVGGVSSVIKSGENGILVRHGNSAALAKAIIAILDNKEMREMFIQNGLKAFKECFTSTVMTRLYEKLYLRQNK
jgi:glycosyltransferase involved in cell wall biosynthesis